MDGSANSAVINPKIVIISGPSGGGKGTVINALLESYPEKFVKAVSATTRDVRKTKEEKGRDYFFVSREEFDKMYKKGEIIERNEYDGNYYGSRRSQIIEKLLTGKNVLLDVDIHGAEEIKKVFSDAVTIFFMPPSVHDQEKRLRDRGTNSEESIKRRISEARNELKKAFDFDCVIINRSNTAREANEAAAEIIDFLERGKKPDRETATALIKSYFNGYEF